MHYETIVQDWHLLAHTQCRLCGRHGEYNGSYCTHCSANTHSSCKSIISHFIYDFLGSTTDLNLTIKGR